MEWQLLEGEEESPVMATHVTSKNVPAVTASMISEPK
jgi:hypothetical protein